MLVRIFHRVSSETSEMRKLQGGRREGDVGVLDSTLRRPTKPNADKVPADPALQPIACEMFGLRMMRDNKIVINLSTSESWR